MECLGKIHGKITTNSFSFIVENETQKFEFVKVDHRVYGHVLAQVVEIETANGSIKALCSVIGYNEKGHIKKIRIPFDPDSEVYRASDDFIGTVIRIPKTEKAAYIGKLDGKQIPVYLDLKKLLTKHISVLAMSGAGKSYTVGVLLEEIMDKKVPLIVIDPHGEYSTLKNPNENKKDIEKMEGFKIKPKGYKRNVVEFGDINMNQNCRPLRISSNLSSDELIHLIPGKLTNAQLGILYGVLKNINKINFDNLLFGLEAEEGNVKWSIMNIIEYLKNLNIFSETPTSLNELVQSGRCSIINLKGMAPEIQEILVYKLCKDLFEDRKKNKIPPFFLVVEEAHNFCPERSFGESKSSKILRNIASEGRKFGLGLCVISQRPARLDKNVVSQCSTQIILKVTNPNDLKAISASVEGLTAETEKEIKNLTVGTALITGVSEMPLFVNIRPRRTEHGGDAVDILDQPDKKEFFEKLEDFESKEMMPLILPKITIKDIKVISNKNIKSVGTLLIPAYLFNCSEGQTKYNILIDMINGNVVTDVDALTVKKLPELDKMTKMEVRMLQAAYSLKKFSVDDMIKKTGVNFDVASVLKLLADKEFIVKKEKYEISDAYVLSKLSKLACFSKIEFKNIAYSKKLDKKVRLDYMKNKLSKFTNVIDQQECWIVKYKTIFEK